MIVDFAGGLYGEGLSMSSLFGMFTVTSPAVSVDAMQSHEFGSMYRASFGSTDVCELKYSPAGGGIFGDSSRRIFVPSTLSRQTGESSSSAPRRSRFSLFELKTGSRVFVD